MAKTEARIATILGALSAGIWLTILIAFRVKTRRPCWKRPDWATLYNNTVGGYVMCSCGYILQTIDGVHEHWKDGHFDRWEQC